MKILCLTKYTCRGPSSRYRIYQFIPYLERRGFELEVQALHTDSYLESRFRGVRPPLPYFLLRFAGRIKKLCRVKKYHLVLIQKEIFPYVPGLVERVLFASGVRVVLDLDDAIFLFYERASSPVKRFFLRQKIPRIITRSTLVLAGNEYIASYARRYSQNVRLLPTVVDSRRFSPAMRNARSILPTIGWIGSPETAPYLREVIAPLERVAEEEDFSLSIVGAGPIEVRGARVEARPWREETEVEDLSSFDIGIMPLPRIEWSKGKCALKLLQYMSMGVASVSSPVGSAKEIIAEGENGFLAADSNEWFEKIKLLVRDARLRREVGRRGREWIERNYNLEKYAPVLADYLEEAVEGKVRAG